MRRLKINREDEVEVGSVVKYRVDGKTTVGEVYNILSNEKYEIIIYDKRLKPVNRHDGSFKIKKTRLHQDGLKWAKNYFA